MSDNFHEISKAICYRLVTDESYFDVVMRLGINPRDWPNTPAKEPALKYLQARKTNGHDYAAWSILEEKGWENISKYAYSLPASEKALKQVYQQALLHSSVQMLGSELIRHPEKAQELITAHEKSVPVGVNCFDLKEVLEQEIELYNEEVMAGRSVVSIPMWPKLSELIGGFNPQRIAVCKAASGFGKSLFSMNLGYAASQKFSVLYINMEMSLRDMVERLCAIVSGKEFKELKNSGIDIHEVLPYLRPESFFMTDGRDLSFNEIRSLAREKSRMCELGLIIVDYDQKLALEVPHGSSEWREIQKVMAAFEELAKELKCFILILAQTNQEGQISSSHRARFSASSVWHFQEHESLGTCITFDKNRFNDRKQALTIQFEGKCGRVAELNCVPLPRKEKK